MAIDRQLRATYITPLATALDTLVDDCSLSGMKAFFRQVRAALSSAQNNFASIDQSLTRALRAYREAGVDEGRIETEIDRIRDLKSQVEGTLQEFLDDWESEAAICPPVDLPVLCEEMRTVLLSL
jgi:hypothetical protein